LQDATSAVPWPRSGAEVVGVYTFLALTADFTSASLPTFVSSMRAYFAALSA
jgi:hypothetical protein